MSTVASKGLGRIDRTALKLVLARSRSRGVTAAAAVTTRSISASTCATPWLCRIESASAAGECLRLGKDAVAPRLPEREQHVARCGGVRGQQLAQHRPRRLSPTGVVAAHHARNAAVAGNHEMCNGASRDLEFRHVRRRDAGQRSVRDDLAPERGKAQGGAVGAAAVEGLLDVATASRRRRRRRAVRG
jgi:hypothetical protein